MQTLRPRRRAGPSELTGHEGAEQTEGECTGSEATVPTQKATQVPLTGRGLLFLSHLVLRTQAASSQRAWAPGLGAAAAIGGLAAFRGVWSSLQQVQAAAAGPLAPFCIQDGFPGCCPPGRAALMVSETVLCGAAPCRPCQQVPGAAWSRGHGRTVPGAEPTPHSAFLHGRNSYQNHMQKTRTDTHRRGGEGFCRSHWVCIFILFCLRVWNLQREFEDKPSMFLQFSTEGVLSLRLGSFWGTPWAGRGPGPSLPMCGVPIAAGCFLTAVRFSGASASLY